MIAVSHVSVSDWHLTRTFGYSVYIATEKLRGVGVAHARAECYRVLGVDLPSPYR